MKRIYTSFLLSLVVVSCVQHEPAEGQYVTINAVFPSKFDSKVVITEKKDDTGLELKWEETDQLLVIGESSEVFSVTEINGNKATFNYFKRKSIYDKKEVIKWKIANLL